MPLHPLAKAFTDLPFVTSSKRLSNLTIQEARAQFLAFQEFAPAGEAMARVEDREIPGPIGPIPLRIYTPIGSGPFPVTVFFHGGGWVVGDLNGQDADCRSLAHGACSIVVSVNYRHAPEFKFPVPVEDAYAATLWISRNAASFNGDGTRLAVSGMSAGGNLAAAVSLMAKDRKTPALKFQLLIVPVTNYAFDTSSYAENGEDYILTKGEMEWFWSHYLQNPDDGANPYASPLRAPDLTGLPPAFVSTAQYDPLRDEGLAYAARLRDAGVAVTDRCYEGMIHMVQGPQAMVDMTEALRQAFETKVP
jgi:acetyl esterase